MVAVGLFFGTDFTWLSALFGDKVVVSNDEFIYLLFYCDVRKTICSKPKNKVHFVKTLYQL